MKKAGKLKEAFREFLIAVMIAEGIRQGTKEKQIEFFSGELSPLFEAYTNLISCLSEQALRGEKRDSLFLPFGRTLSEAAFYFSEMIRGRYLLTSVSDSNLPIPLKNLPLNNNEVLLEYAITENATYLFVVRKDKIKILKLEIKEKELKNIIERLKTNFDTLFRDNFFINRAKMAYDILLSDALKDVPFDHYVIIVPDRFLGLFPFEALVVEYRKGKKILYLLEIDG